MKAASSGSVRNFESESEVSGRNKREHRMIFTGELDMSFSRTSSGLRQMTVEQKHTPSQL